MAFVVNLLLETDSVAVRDVICDGACREMGEEERASQTCLVFPYRGVFVRRIGDEDVVAEPNQVLLFNRDEAYRVSHPVAGGDACLSVAMPEALLAELVPDTHCTKVPAFAFDRQKLQIDARAQALVALLRHGLATRAAEMLEGETLALTLVRRAVGRRSVGVSSSSYSSSYGRRKLADRAKLVLSSDLARRWTLGEIAAETGVSPVYLTQVFQQVEGVPLYRYQLRLRLAKALDLLGDYDDLTALGLELGFSSHSHFSAAFRQAYGRTPAEFQRFVGLR
ncbi:AraC family transcriptional regulator [Ciceribacter lividus]|uniref:AraC family transcriptional regulator n=1 Tax=Ciceribacter lividus TaxID=1197950 RepID=A0A6I7HQA6_9HYPH|nr:AraC family transcriptional regulator [Ciceribacter lividus]RCW28011.1 AraC family transcriptional regulator [Ciceribacter lividus]